MDTLLLDWLTNLQTESSAQGMDSASFGNKNFSRRDENLDI
jgi:hypothetical protein